jgi:hypothetical protein
MFWEGAGFLSEACGFLNIIQITIKINCDTAVFSYKNTLPATKFMETTPSFTLGPG